MPYADLIANHLGPWSETLNLYAILFRLALTFAFALIIGWERSRKLHSAGLRTFILTMLAGTAASILDLFGSTQITSYLPILSAGAVIGIAIISGNSFFYSSKNQVKGLTTAVALWASCFLGILIGAGLYTASLVFFLTLLVCLAILPDLEVFLKDRSNHFEIHLELTSKESLADFIATIRKLGLRIDDIEANPAYIGSGLSVFSISITITRDELQKYKKHSEIIEALKSLEYVSFIEEIF